MTLHDAVRDTLTGHWLTIWEVQNRVKLLTGEHFMETTISARIRDLRKAKHGALTVNRKFLGDGKWIYNVEAR